MLTWLKIKNLALVEDAEVEFTPGLNIISGETGSGKSVIIGAVSLLLGRRSDKSVIRKDKKRCELSAVIQLFPPLKELVQPLFEEHCIPIIDDEILLRRVITPSSSRNYINDTNVTLTILARLSEYLVDFHGPNHNHSLTKPSTQLDLLDRFGGLEQKRSECADIYYQIRQKEKELNDLQAHLPDAIEAEYLRRIINDVKKVSPQPNEEEELSSKHKIAANAKNILSLASNTKYMLYDAEESILNNLAGLNRELNELTRIDPDNADKFTTQLDTITEEIKELAFDLEAYASNIELDEYELAELEERLSNIIALKRRYGPTIENVLESSEKAKERLNKLENFEGLKQDLQNNLNTLNQNYNKQALELRKKRKEVSKEFVTKTKEKLNKLGFLKADISVTFEEQSPSPTGTDKIEFQFCANPGEQEQPLRKVASSGEISRVMLAIKTVLSNADNIPILIFDEIDANIGGEVANQVGFELKKLGQKHHVLCISHQPQVAAFADSHYLVTKTIGNDHRTYSKVSRLADKERVTELGRMLGGGKAAEQHASKIITFQK